MPLKMPQPGGTTLAISTSRVMPAKAVGPHRDFSFRCSSRPGSCPVAVSKPCAVVVVMMTRHS
jgi:hypothetical protein